MTIREVWKKCWEIQHVFYFYIQVIVLNFIYLRIFYIL